MKKILVLLVLLSFLGVAEAQTPATSSERYFGMGAGSVTGYGLLYRDWTGPVGWQIVGMPLYSSSQAVLDGGFSLYWLINDSGWTRFFLYSGAMGHGESNTFYDINNAPSRMFTWGAGVGGGIGLEVTLWDRIAVDVQGGFQGRWDNNSPFLGPTGEVALSYRL